MDMTTIEDRLHAPRCCLVTLASRQINKTALDLVEQRRWQRTVISRLTVEWPDARARPDKAIALRQDDPGPRGVQTEPAFRGRRNLNRRLRIRRRRMGDGQDTDCRRAILPRRNNRQNQCGTIFIALFPSLQMLPVPQIGIAKDPADLWFSRQHACPSAVRR